jgi:hypothetical protein
VSATLFGRPRAREPGPTLSVTARSPADAAASSAAWLHRLARQDDAASFRRRAVRQCRDLVATLRGHREPVDEEPWQAPRDAESRLLAQVDAITGLGDEAVSFALEDVPDPDLPDADSVFAALFILGCAKGHAWTAELRRLYCLALSRTPQERAAATEALSLAPIDTVDAVAGESLAAANAPARASAVRVLAHRGALRLPQWRAALCDQDATVRAAAAAAPLHGFDPDEASATLAQAARDQEFVARHVLRSAATLRAPAVRGVLLRVVEQNPAWADAAHSLALYGRPDDLPRLQQAAALHPGAVTFTALGELGYADAIPGLLRAVADASAEPHHRKAARAAALAITGQPPAIDANAQGYGQWAEYARGLSREHRWRRGLPHSATALARLLRDGPPSRPERQQLYRELAAVTQWRTPRFSAFDFIAEQCFALQSIDAWLAQHPYAGH